MINQILLLSSILTCSMMTGYASTTSLITQSQNTGCTSPSQSQLKYTSQTALSFVWQAYYYDSATGSSVRLSLKRENSNSNYKWIFVDQSLNSKTIQVANTINQLKVSYSVSSMQGKNLLIRRTTNGNIYQYFMYKFDPSKTTISGELISILKGYTNPAIFRYDELLMQLIIVNTNSNNYLFMKIKQQLSGGGIIKFLIFQQIIISTNQLVIKICYLLNQPTYYFFRFIDQKWQSVSAKPFSEPSLSQLNKMLTTQTVMSYPFKQIKLTVLSIVSFNKRSGYLYVLDNSATPIKINCQTSTSNYIDYSDRVQNFIRIGSAQIHWVSLKQDGLTWINSNILISQIPILNLQSVALTKNNAIFLYTDKMVYYQHVDTDSVKLMFGNSFTSDNTIDFTQTTKQYKATKSCFCQAINKFSCFAASLSCIILIRAC